MTDHDRGAYTPQPDAPLQFDARGPRGRKPMPMTLIGSGAVLLVVLGALAVHYRHDTSKTEAAPLAVDTTPRAKIVAPVATLAPKDAGVDVLNTPGALAQNKLPKFTPPPEAPKPRAQLTVQTDEAALPSKPLPTTNVAAPAPIAVAKASPPLAKTVPTYHAPGTVAVAAPAAKPDATSVVAKVAATSAAPAKTKPTATIAAAKTAPTTVKAASGAAVVQIGAFSSTSQSDTGYSTVASAMSGEMAGKAKRIETVEVNGKTFFRTSVTGFSSRSAADAFCKALTAKGHTCFAKG